MAESCVNRQRRNATYAKAPDPMLPHKRVSTAYTLSAISLRCSNAQCFQLVKQMGGLSRTVTEVRMGPVLGHKHLPGSNKQESNECSVKDVVVPRLAVSDRNSLINRTADGVQDRKCLRMSLSERGASHHVLRNIRRAFSSGHIALLTAHS